MLLASMAVNNWLWAQGKIIVTALPSNPAPKKGEVVAVPMLVDMSQTSFRLGAVAASAQWDSSRLAFRDFLPGASEGFTDPVVNTRKTAEAKLVFASINSAGATAQVNILTIRLEARVDIVQWQGLQLDLTELVAAESFADLLPFVERVITGVKTTEHVTDLPTTFALFQNIPNPFNRSTERSRRSPETMIRYELPVGGRVVLTIYNLNGQTIRNLAEGEKPAGRYAAFWNGKDDRNQNVASGIYFYRLEAHADNGKTFVATRKMSLLR
jgi:hypothetical protein